MEVMLCMALEVRGLAVTDHMLKCKEIFTGV
jgi:hypothetical protein